MSRFQAVTSTVLDEQLDNLREEMGLRDNQKAELLRELATITAWVVAQARAGRVVEARGPSGTEVLHHPVVDRGVPHRIVLKDDEAARLAELLAAPPKPSAELRATMARLADPNRQPPTIRWSK